MHKNSMRPTAKIIGPIKYRGKLVAEFVLADSVVVEFESGLGVPNTLDVLDSSEGAS